MNITKEVLNNAGNGIFGLDLQGHTVFTNKAAEAILGYDAAEMIGISQHSLIHHTHSDGTPYPREDCKIYAAFKDGKTHTEEHEVFWHKDGHAIPVEYTSTPIRNDDGDLTGAVVVFHDITERKKVEEELVAANNELEEFSYRVSHDLRSPLLSSIGLLKITKTLIEIDNKEKALTSVDLIHDSLKKNWKHWCKIFFTSPKQKMPLRNYRRLILRILLMTLFKNYRTCIISID